MIHSPINQTLRIVLCLRLLFVGWQINQTAIINLITYINVVLANLPGCLEI